MVANLSSLPEFERFITDHPAAFVYFSREDCGVCKALGPKLQSLLEARFPRLAQAAVDCGQSPQPASAQSVFSVPTAIVFMEGREAVRFSRAFSPTEVVGAVERPYRLLFD